MHKRRNSTIAVLFLLAIALIASACGGKKAPVGQEPISSGEGNNDAADTAPVANENLPEGWSVYQGTAVPVSFWLPAGWDTVELGDTVVVNDTQFTDPLPPELSFASVFIGVSQESPAQAREKLQEDNTTIQEESVLIGDTPATKYSYEVKEPPIGPYVFYRIPTGEKFLEVGAVASYDGSSQLAAILNHLALRRAQ